MYQVKVSGVTSYQGTDEQAAYDEYNACFHVYGFVELVLNGKVIACNDPRHDPYGKPKPLQVSAHFQSMLDSLLPLEDPR